MEGRSQGKRRVTAREAATLLGVHYNTVRNRIKDGTIQAEKVVTEHGPTWMIDPDSLTAKTPTSAGQQVVGRVPQEALTLLAREIAREAGLTQAENDVAREDRIERSNLELEAAKTQLLITSGVLVAGAAVSSMVIPENGNVTMLWLLVLAVSMLLLAVTFALSLMYIIAWSVATQITQITRTRLVYLLLSSGMFLLGLLYLLLFIQVNALDRSPDEISLVDQTVIVGAVGVPVLMIVSVFAILSILYLRRRRYRSRRGS